MAELRWVLLALGVLLVVGVYLWGRGAFRRNEFSRRSRRKRRSEPRISPDDEPISDDVLFTRPGEAVEPISTPALGPPEEVDAHVTADEPVEPAPGPEIGPDKIVALRFVPRSSTLDAVEAVRALRDAGLEHGRYGIFHYPDPIHAQEPQFSVASLTEPGSFDLDRLYEQPLAGMSFFMILPGVGDPVDRFDAMVGVARSLAHRLDAELFDDRGSSWSIQRERYIREELISYRLQYSQS
jgi:cell division protein ZipA